MAPYGRYTALLQLSLSRVYASRLETRDSRSTRNWLVAFLWKFSAQSLHSNYLWLFFFMQRSRHAKLQKQKVYTSRILGANARCGVEESSNFDAEISMHNASCSAQGAEIQPQRDQGREVSYCFDSRSFGS